MKRLLQFQINKIYWETRGIGQSTANETWFVAETLPWLMKCWGSRNVGTDYPIMQYTSIFCNVIFPKARFFELFNSVFSRFPPSFLHLVEYWSVFRQDEMCIWAVTYLFTQWWILFKFLPDLLTQTRVNLEGKIGNYFKFIWKTRNGDMNLILMIF